MRTLFKALLAATALLPAAVPAMAQEWSGNRGGDRSERGDRVDRGPIGGDGERRGGPGWNRGGGEVQADRPAPQPGRADWNRPDRQGMPRGDANRIENGGGAPDRGGWDGRRPDGSAGPDRAPVRPDRQAYGDRPQVDLRRGDDRGDGRWNGQRNWDGRPNGTYRPGWNQRDGWNGNGQRFDGRGGRNQGWGNDGRFADRGAWNRTWRNDGRYDWNRYRTGNRNAYHLPRYYAPYGWSGGYRRFSVGVRLNSVLWNQSYWIGDPYAYRLPEAYGPYRWVRYYNDALLVDIRYGEVVDVVHDIFW